MLQPATVFILDQLLLLMNYVHVRSGAGQILMADGENAAPVPVQYVPLRALSSSVLYFFSSTLALIRSCNARCEPAQC